MSEEMAYVASVKDCGCLVAFIMDKPDLADYAQKDIADWLNRGLIVERVPVAGKRLQKCTHDRDRVPS